MAHKILLLNFAGKDANTIAKAGYNVERGFIGIARPDYFPFFVPHPIYEYDLLFYNSRITPELQKEYSSTTNLIADGSYKTLNTFSGPPHVRISFLGEECGRNSLVHGGVSFVKTERAEQNVSSFIELSSQGAFTIDELHNLLARFKGQVAKVGKFICQPESVALYPFHHNVVLVARSGKAVAAYGTTYSDKVFPHYILLPELQSNVQAVIAILKCLEDVFPSLFPDKVKRDWLASEEFLLPQELKIKGEIERIINEATSSIQKKKEEKERLSNENSFVRNLLVANESSDVEPAMRLSGVVRKALEVLGFTVEDIDEKTKGAIKKEDFWVLDGNFLAITEVTGIVHKNPKVKEFNDILARVATIYKRKGDLVVPGGCDVRGLLVLNYDTDNHPAKRPRVFTGEDEHIVDTAIEQGIGLLSTVELHRIVAAVLHGIISKEDARAILRKPGRIEFDRNKKS